MELSTAAELLKKGEIIAFPTETVYGLGAPIFNTQAIAKIFAAKGRPSDNPLIAHIAAKEDLQRIAIDIPDEAYLLIDAFFPGPLTLILFRHLDVPDIVSAGLPTIAVRMPSHPIALELIRLTGQPLVAPSANLSGKPSSTTAQHVLDDLHGRIAGVIDGGPCSLGIESTVIKLGAQPLILRPGSITASQIEDVLKRKVEIYDKQSAGPVPSPGMKYRHYAPKASLKLFTDEEELYAHVDAEPGIKRLILSKVSAKELYALLRQADQENYKEIAILCDEETAKDIALMNRLKHAAYPIPTGNAGGSLS